MRTPGTCAPAYRFLQAETWFPAATIPVLQAACKRAYKNRTSDADYERFIDWMPQEQEIAVFTLYAYADLPVPGKFDIIFPLDSPKDFVQVPYTLTQSILEATWPVGTIGSGHKHLCVFTFEKKVPDIFRILYPQQKTPTRIPGNQRKLGFCKSEDFEAIALRCEKIEKLKLLHGDKWWEYEEREEDDIQHA